MNQFTIALDLFDLFILTRFQEVLKILLNLTALDDAVIAMGMFIKKPRFFRTGTLQQISSRS